MITVEVLNIEQDPTGFRHLTANRPCEAGCWKLVTCQCIQCGTLCTALYLVGPAIGGLVQRVLLLVVFVRFELFPIL